MYSKYVTMANLSMLMMQSQSLYIKANTQTLTSSAIAIRFWSASLHSTVHHVLLLKLHQVRSLMAAATGETPDQPVQAQRFASSPRHPNRIMPLRGACGTGAPFLQAGESAARTCRAAPWS